MSYHRQPTLTDKKTGALIRRLPRGQASHPKIEDLVQRAAQAWGVSAGWVRADALQHYFGKYFAPSYRDPNYAKPKAKPNGSAKRKRMS